MIVVDLQLGESQVYSSAVSGHTFTSYGRLLTPSFAIHIPYVLEQGLSARLGPYLALFL